MEISLLRLIVAHATPSLPQESSFATLIEPSRRSPHAMLLA
jgi:hypothetical protein